MSEPEMGSAFALVALPSSKHDAKLLILFGIFGPGVQRKNTEFLFLPSIGGLAALSVHVPEPNVAQACTVIPTQAQD